MVENPEAIHIGNRSGAAPAESRRQTGLSAPQICRIRSVGRKRLLYNGGHTMISGAELFR